MLSVNNVLGCGITCLYGFNDFAFAWDSGSEDALRKKLIQTLDDYVNKPRGSYSQYTRKYICVLTDGQPIALSVMRNYKHARLLTKTMNYRYNNYVFEINTVNCREPLSEIPFNKRNFRKERKGALSNSRVRNDLCK